LLHASRRARAQPAAARAAAIRSARSSVNPSLDATDKNYNRFSRAAAMSKQRVVPPAAELSPDVIRRYLAETSQRELDELREALDVRLAALEAALTHPNPQTSLEELVLELARVATAEAESAAARACLEAHVDAQERAASVDSEARRSLEAERAIAKALRLELEQARTALEREREAVARLRRDGGQLKSALESEQAAGAERDRGLEQARAALLAAQAAGTALRHDVEDAQIALRKERSQQVDARVQRVEALAALEREVAASKHATEAAIRDRDALTADLQPRGRRRWPPRRPSTRGWRRSRRSAREPSGR